MKAAAFLLILVAARPFRATADDLVRVGMDPLSAPWAYVPGLEPARLNGPAAFTEAELKKLEGLEVDILNALARRLGVQTRIVPTAWPDLEKGLLDRRYDLILSEWTPHADTLPEIAASLPYYEWGLLVAARADDASIRSLRDLEGKRVGHCRDPSVRRGLQAVLDGLGAHFVYGPHLALFNDLGAGGLDAVVFDSVYVRWRVMRDGAFRVVGEPLNRLAYHVGVRREDAALLSRVNSAIRDLRASAEMAEIRRHWEGR